ncbi:hypothetical protein [Streptomyces sp. NPDC058867]|uniref:hypothetical protein n=1 Tax=unclassified Streptomyces TaxID=2593676 RepID=UPI0036B1992F
MDRVLLVTVGSPLGMDAVADRLLAGGPHRPGNVRGWLNAWSAADPIAIGCPLRERGWGEVEQRIVVNGTDRAHDLTEYLSHTEVARAIGEALA